MTAMAAALVTGEAKRPFIQKLFTDIAPRYDWFNRLTSCGLDQGWRRVALREGALAPGQRVLDVCAGTGDLALLAAQFVGAPGLVIGADMNPAMLARAKDKRSRGAPVTWLQADTLALPFPTGSFDRVTIGFSTRNLVDLRAGLREMVRVLRPGGRLIILETGRPANPLICFGYQAYLFTVARAIGFLLTGKLWPFTYLARSVQAFMTPQQMVEALGEAGAPARYVPLSGGLASLFVGAKP